MRRVLLIFLLLSYRPFPIPFPSFLHSFAAPWVTSAMLLGQPERSTVRGSLLAPLYIGWLLALRAPTQQASDNVCRARL